MCRDLLNPSGPVQKGHIQVRMNQIQFAKQLNEKNLDYLYVNVYKMFLNFHTHMSIKLSSLFKIVVLTIRVDQNSRGIHFGSIGYLLHEKKQKKT